MAQHFISRLGPFDSSEAPDSETEQADRPGTTTAVLSQLGSSLARDYTTTPASEVALDLVLNEIAHHARLATTAPGAVIGLLRGSEMVCRAATGANAPEFAVLLNSRSAILASCLESGAVQRCDDAEKDARIEPIACRRLGVRSVVLVPVFDKNERAAGVFAVFSPRAGAFSEHEVLTLQALARRVATSADLVNKAMALSSAEAAAPSFAGLSSSSPARTRLRLWPGLHGLRTPVRDGRLLLMIAVIAVSMALGWVLGRAHRSPMAAQAVEKPAVAALPPQPQPGPELAAPTAVTPGTTAPENPSATQPSAPATPATDTASNALVPPVPSVKDTEDKENKKEGKEKNTASTSMAVPPAGPAVKKSATTSARPAPKAKPPQAAKKASGEMILFEDKRAVAQAERSPAMSQPLQAAPRAVPLAQPSLRAGVEARPVPAQTQSATPAAMSGAPALAVPEITALANLVHRVEPQYPAMARQQHIQGRVVLNILVGKTGAIQVVTPVSGDPELSRAAVDAVRQWHFKPLVRNAQQISFTSHITIDFALP